MGSEPLQSAKDGLSEIIGDLLIEGFQIEVLNQPINEVLSGQVDERFNVPVVELGNDSGEITTTIGLADLFNGVEDPAKAQRFLTEDQKQKASVSFVKYNDPTLRQNVPYQMPRETISEEVVPGDPEYVEPKNFRQVPLEQAAEEKLKQKRLRVTLAMMLVGMARRQSAVYWTRRGWCRSCFGPAASTRPTRF